MFSPHNTLKQLKDSIVPVCEHFGLDRKVIEKVDLQWRSIHFQTWEKTKTAIEFWSEVNDFTDAAGNNPFSDLVSLALSVLSLPWSNAACERIFSQMNIIKNKTRNRMQSPMLVSLLHVRSGLKRNNKCCNNFKLPDSVVRPIGTMEVYHGITDKEETEVFDDLPLSI